MTFHNSTPKEKDYQWQIDIFPVFSILRINYMKDLEGFSTMEQKMIRDDKTNKYYSICIGWLFWQVNFIIYK